MTSARSKTLTLAALAPFLWSGAGGSPASQAGESGAPQLRGEWVRGITLSTRRSGQEWASEALGAELERIRTLGANWIAIHPYAGIRGDGRVLWRRFLEDGRHEEVTRPIREAHARGLSVLVHPHLAHWGSPFDWRGAIDFEDPEERARFFREYREWILALAELAREADGLVLGSELDRLTFDEGAWRELVAQVRTRTSAHLTFASNWTDYERVPFWDALDAVGVQAYFPLCQEANPTRASLRAGWEPVLTSLRRVHARTGKPVVFTELGYDVSLDAAREPWASGRVPAADLERARALQAECLSVAFEAIGPERAWLRGAFLWKWFIGPSSREDFRIDSPRILPILAEAWGGEVPR